MNIHELGPNVRLTDVCCCVLLICFHRCIHQFSYKAATVFLINFLTYLLTNLLIYMFSLRTCAVEMIDVPSADYWPWQNDEYANTYISSIVTMTVNGICHDDRVNIELTSEHCRWPVTLWLFYNSTAPHRTSKMSLNWQSKHVHELHINVAL